MKIRAKWINRKGPGSHRGLVAVILNRNWPRPSYKLSLGLRGRWWAFQRDLHSWIVVFAGLRVHWRASYGGQFG